MDQRNERESVTIQNTFNLKSDGDKLTGTLETSAGGQSRSTDIKGRQA